MESAQTRDCCVIKPDSGYRAIWDFTLMVILTYQAVMIPVRVAYDLEQSDFTCKSEVVIDVLFILDIALNFNTGFYREDIRVKQRSEICADYLRVWFWIDLVSSIPYTWIFAWIYDLDLCSIEEGKIDGE